MQKTKTKTAVAVTLVALAIILPVAYVVVYNTSGSSIRKILSSGGRGGTSVSSKANEGSITNPINPKDTINPATPSLVTSVCGNGKVETGEECDDGNKVSGDGCSGCPLGCNQTSFNSPLLGIATATATATCATANDCNTTGYGQERWTCKNGQCQAASCGDGFCNACVFSPCGSLTENQTNCAKDCGSPIAPTPPAPVPPVKPTPDQCQQCLGGCKKENVATPTINNNVIDINSSSLFNFQGPAQHLDGVSGRYESTHLSISPKGTLYFKISVPSGLGQLRIGQASYDQSSTVKIFTQKDTLQGIETNYASARSLWGNPYAAGFQDLPKGPGSDYSGQAIAARLISNGYSNLGGAFYKDNPQRWLSIEESFAGDEIRIKQPQAGTYYIILRNESTTVTASNSVVIFLDK